MIDRRFTAMRRSAKIVLSVLLLLSLSAAALAVGGSAGPLPVLWNSGCDLLFRTENVTLDGEASFALDGEWFKTAALHYVQDGDRSLYDLKLTAPSRISGEERKNGWTILADEKGNIFVMEAYKPGTYSTGSDDTNRSLLRRTFQLDALAELGSHLVGLVESALPEGSVTETASEAGLRTVRIALSDGSIPDMAVSALNLAAEHFLARWFTWGTDFTTPVERGIPFNYHETVTRALTHGTVRWVMKNADVSFNLDAQSRITAVQGSLTVTSEYWDKSTRDVSVDFHLTVSEYGSSSVTPFDPESWGVMLRED